LGICLAAHSAHAVNPISWVGFKGSLGGAPCVGDGVTDDTACMQAKIDYAFANNLSGVYCPKGNYLTSDSLWLDPPGNMRLTTFTGTGYISGTTFTVSSGSTGGLAIGSHIYGAGVISDTVIQAGTGPYTVNNSQTVGSSGSPVALTGNNPSNPTVSGFSFSFFGDPSDNQGYPNCRISPNFNNGHAIEVGTGAGMMVANIAVQGHQVSGPSGYRGGMPSNSVGIALNGGNAGSSPALIRDVSIDHFYTLINTESNNNGSLNDGNTFERISGSSGYVGINIQGSNTLVNHVLDPRLIDIAVGVSNLGGNPLTVSGGQIQSETGAYNSYTMGSVSAITNVGTNPSGDGPFRFTATLSAPTVTGGFDPTGFGWVGNSKVYSWWGLLTPDFGVVPMTLTAWNSGTNQATFQLYEPWVFGEFGAIDLSSTTHLSAEIQAVTTVYAVERVYTARGAGITLDSVTTENEGSCATVIDNINSQGANVPTHIKDLLNLGSAYVFSVGNTAYTYCVRTTPVLEQESPGNPIIIDGGDWASGNNTASARRTIQTTADNSGIIVRGAANLNAMFQDGHVGGYGWGQITGVTNSWESEARGLGVLDKDYSLPSLVSQARGLLNSSEITSPFCGVEPCPWALPNLSATTLALVCPGGNIASCGTLSTFYGYFPVACRTVFKSVDWNTGVVTVPSTVGGGIFLRSASCPGYSWGQNITDTTLHAYQTVIGVTLTSVAWHHIGQSPVLYLDAATIRLMFPGLGFTLDSGDGSGAVPYVVTGVYEDLGYVTVIRSSAASGGLLAGTATTPYSCTSGCTIGQMPYAWSRY
jgi:hypothetical protein